MKNLLIFFSSLLVLSFSACTDLCDSVDCTNGTCTEGTCTCDEGYAKDDGNLCQSLTSFYAGTYDASQTCASGGNASGNYSIEIDSTGSQTVLIKNVDNSGVDLEANITDKSTFVIPEQVISGDTIAAFTGSLTGSTLTFNYKRSGSASADCSITANKQ